MTTTADYGAPVVTYEERALALVEREGVIRQGEALTELSGGFDTRRDGPLRALRALVAAGQVRIEWDVAGWPYYVAAGMPPSPSRPHRA